MLGHEEPRAAGRVLERPLDARVAPAEDDPLAVGDLLDHALALLATVPGHAHGRVLLGCELDLVGQPLLQLRPLGDELPGAVPVDGKDDLAVHDGHRRLLQLMGCGTGYHGRKAQPRSCRKEVRRCPSSQSSSTRTRAESARSTSTRACCASASCSSARRSTTRSPTSSSPSCCTWRPTTPTRTSRCTSTRPAGRCTPGWRSTTRCGSSSPTWPRSAAGSPCRWAR